MSLKINPDPEADVTDNFGSEPDPANDRPGPSPPGEPGETVLRAEELFGGRQVVWIELHGERYRLRITRRGKLILQK